MPPFLRSRWVFRETPFVPLRHALPHWLPADIEMASPADKPTDRIPHLFARDRDRLAGIEVRYPLINLGQPFRVIPRIGGDGLSAEVVEPQAEFCPLLAWQLFNFGNDLLDGHKGKMWRRDGESSRI